jgi:hypothetical protein
MSTTSAYQRYDPLRACDICGHLWHKSELTKIAPLRWACPDDKDGLTAEQISRHNANVRPLRVKAVKHAKGPSETPTYQQAEARLLNLILTRAPNSVFRYERGELGGQQDADNALPDRSRAVGWMCIYLSNLVLENQRPTAWITQARAKLVTLADSIVAGQRLTTTFFPVTDGAEYGGIYLSDTPASGATTFDVYGSAACLLGLLGAYRVTSATKYIIAARAVAVFLRRAQCVGNYVSFNAQYTASTRLPVGPFPATVKIDLSTSTNVTVVFYDIALQGLICAWALHALQVLDGDASYGAGAASVFTVDPGATLSSMVSSCLAWWSAGAPDAGGATVIGLSTMTPRDGYAAGASGGVSTGSWTNAISVSGGRTVRGFEFAMAVRSLYEVGGYDAAGALYEWLRSFGSDPANRPPSTWTHERIEQSTLGAYDPTIAIARNLLIADANGSAMATEAVDTPVGSSYSAPGYDWRTVGLLAPIQSARASSTFRTAKDEMTKIRRRRFSARLTSGLPTSTSLSLAAYDRVEAQDDLGMLAFSGLSFQTSVGGKRSGWGGSQNFFTHYVDITGACMAADAYRYPPGAFPSVRG